MRTTRRHIASLVLATALIASACSVHIVGDSSAWLVQAYANAISTITMTGSTEPNCGYGPFNGNRVQPSGLGTDPGYPSCVIDWNRQSPDEPDDVIVAFVSIHDAMCSTVDGCLPFDTAAYQAAHADLVATGHPVVWVEVPPVGDAALQARMAGLNVAVAGALGCSLVPSSIRVAPTWDGIHYTVEGGLLVGGRLSELTAADACP